MLPWRIKQLISLARADQIHLLPTGGNRKRCRVQVNRYLLPENFGSRTQTRSFRISDERRRELLADRIEEAHMQRAAGRLRAFGCAP